jgi:hypothetical protein
MAKNQRLAMFLMVLTVYIRAPDGHKLVASCRNPE